MDANDSFQLIILAHFLPFPLAQSVPYPAPVPTAPRNRTNRPPLFASVLRRRPRIGSFST